MFLSLSLSTSRTVCLFLLHLGSNFSRAQIFQSEVERGSHLRFVTKNAWHLFCRFNRYRRHYIVVVIVDLVVIVPIQLANTRVSAIFSTASRLSGAHVQNLRVNLFKIHLFARIFLIHIQNGCFTVVCCGKFAPAKE